jgi:SAM-dependent methyltransferase
MSPQSIWSDPTYYKFLEGILEGDKPSYELVREYGWNFDSAHAKVLDVGCGTGRMAALFPLASYSGYDSSPESVSRCVAKGLSVSQASIYHLPDADQSADLVISIDVLLHIAYTERALKELWRVTGKRLIVSGFYRWFGVKYIGPVPTWTEDTEQGLGWWAPHNYVPMWMWWRIIRRLPGIGRIRRVFHPGGEKIAYWILDRQ